MPSILLVEDNPVTRLATQRLLIKAGFEVVIAQDGEQAIQLATNALPDVILLDMLLPKLDGPTVLTRIKNNPATAHIPVIVLTALSSRNAAKLKEASASAFIEKAHMLDDSTVLFIVLNSLLPLSGGSRLLPENSGEIAVGAMTPVY